MTIRVSANTLRVSLFTAALLCVAALTNAQTIPSPWTATDIGAPQPAGSSTYASGVFTINAGGADIWGTSDQFRFIYRQISGDGEIVARVDSVTTADPYTKAGVMVRSSLSANAAHGYAVITAQNGVWFNRRTANGGTSTTTAGTTGGAPMWLRATRVGTRVTTSYSTTGTNWTTIGSDTIALGTTAYFGLAVTSHNSSMLTTAKLSNVTVTGGATGGTLPSGQQQVGIGAPAIAGSATYSAGTYTIRAAGADIWDVSDQFHFVYQPVTGNVELVARVASITRAHKWSKAGVMVRESLTAASRHATVFASAGQGYAFQRRDDTGAYSLNTSGGTGTPPGWVRLVRTGDLFESYKSTDGTNWTRIGSDTIAMGATVYVGLAVTSHDTGTATTAVVDNVRITAATSPVNQPPAVSLTAPANGSAVTAPATVAVTATASDPENRMLSVDFYAGSTLISRDTTAPYSTSWSATAAGTYALTAVAHDADGGSTTSGAVNVTVSTASNRPPTVSLATGGTSFVAPATINLAATASDPEGQVARVEFFNGTTRLSNDTAAPYSYSWTNVAAGTYTVRAVVYDAAGASGSVSVTVTVTAAPSSAPTSVVFTASTDHATNVSSYVLKIFAAGANPTTATPIATSDLGKPTPDSSRTITVNRASVFTALAAGNYLATVTAIGSGGQTQSASVSFTR